MNITKRVKEDLIRIIKRIENSTFEEYDIYIFLINVRSVFKEQNLVVEIANFIAHPEGRDRGFFYNNVNLIYGQLEFVFANTTNAQLKFFKIEKRLFENVILGSVKFYDDSENGLWNTFKKNKTECLNFIKQSYKLEGDSYHLVNTESLYLITQLVSKVMKTMSIKEAIKTSLLIQQLHYILKNLKPILNIKYDEDAIIKKEADDIIVCIMCLLHSAFVNIYDNNKVECILSLSRMVDRDEKGKLKHSKWTINISATIKFKGQDSGTFSYPLMGLKVDDISKYFTEKHDFHSEHASPLYFLNLFNAIRDKNGILIIDRKI